MAADLSVQIGITGNAAQQAQQITQELTKMGAAGDEAATKVSQVGQKMGQGMREASQAAAASRGIFAELNRAMGTPAPMQSQQAAIAAMVELQRSMAQMVAMQREAGEVSKSLGGMPFLTNMQAQAKAAAESMALIVEELERMAAAGKAPAEMFALMQEKVGPLVAEFDKVTASNKVMADGIATSTEQATAKTFDLSGALKEVSGWFAKTGTEAAASGTKVAETQAKVATEVNRGTTAIRAQGVEMEKTSGHASRLGQQLMIAERGVHDIMTVTGLGAGPANSVGRLARGVDDLILAVQRGGVGILAFAGSMAALSVAMKAVQVPLDFLKNAFAAGIGQEKLTIQLTGMLGSLGAAQKEIEQIKGFVTGSSAAGLGFEDAEKGAERLQMATGGVMSLAQALPILAEAYARSGQSADRLGEEIGKVSNYMLVGQPIQYRLLETLVNMKVLTAAAATELENMSKKGASSTAMLKAFETDLLGTGAATKEASNDVGGLWERLQQIIGTRITEPIGTALTKGLAPAIKQLDEMFDDPKIKSGIDGFAYNLELQLRTVFILVKEQGFVPAFKAGVDEIGKYIKEQSPGWFESMRKADVAHGQGQAPFTFGPFAGGGALNYAVDQSKVQQQADSLNSPAKSALQLLWQVFTDRLVGDWVQLFKELNLQNVDWGKIFRLPSLPSLSVGPTSFVTPTTTGTPLNQAQIDAYKAAAEKTTTLNTSTSELNTSVTTLNNSILLLKNQLATGIYSLGAGGFGLGAGGNKLWPGASRGLSEWAPGEPMTRANQQGPTYQQLQMGDVALSPDLMMKLFNTLDISVPKFVDILDQAGNVILAHQHVADISYVHEGLPNVNTYEVWGRKWDQAGQVVLAATNEYERAQRKAAAEMNRPAPGGDGKGGLTPPPALDPKSTKAMEEALKQLTQETGQLNTAWGIYGKQVSMINEKEKAGLMSTADATKAKLDLDKQMGSQVDAMIAKVTAQEAAFKKAYPTEPVTKYEEELDKLHEKHDQIATDMQKIQGAQGNLWAAFGQGVQQALNKMGSLSDEVQKAGEQITTEISSGIGNALTNLETGTGKVGDAFKSMATSILNSFNKIIADEITKQLMSLIKSLVQNIGSILGGGGAYPTGATGNQFQSGGLVYGPSGIDKVPSALTAGEYVLTQRAVAKYGLALIDSMNAGTWQESGPGMGSVRGYASGGFVGSATSPYNIPPSQNINAATSNQTVAVITNVTVAGNAGTPPAGAPVGGTGGQGGISNQDIAQFQNAITVAVKGVILQEKRPGGLLSRQQMTV